VTDERMSVEHWQTNSDAGKQKYSDKNLSHCQSFPPQMPYGLVWNQTPVSKVTAQWLTA